MPNPTKGVPVELDKKRHLRYPLGVLREIDETTDIVEVLYLGLKHEDPDLTEEEVGEIVDMEMLVSISPQIKQATGGVVDIDALFGIAQETVQESAEGNASTEAPTG